jgi:hypothetical protein
VPTSAISFAAVIQHLAQVEDSIDVLRSAHYRTIARNDATPRAVARTDRHLSTRSRRQADRSLIAGLPTPDLSIG